MAYLFACLTKENGLTIIALIPLTLFFFSEWKLKKIAQISSIYLIPVVIYFVLREMATGQGNYTHGIIDNILYGVEGVGEHIATSIMMVGKYILLLFFPYPLSYDYSAFAIPIVGIGDWRFLLSALICLLIFGIAVWKFKEKSPISYGIFLFAITFSI